MRAPVVLYVWRRGDSMLGRWRARGATRDAHAGVWGGRLRGHACGPSSHGPISDTGRWRIRPQSSRRRASCGCRTPRRCARPSGAPTRLHGERRNRQGCRWGIGTPDSSSGHDEFSVTMRPLPLSSKTLGFEYRASRRHRHDGAVFLFLPYRESEVAGKACKRRPSSLFNLEDGATGPAAYTAANVIDARRRLELDRRRLPVRNRSGEALR